MSVIHHVRPRVSNAYLVVGDRPILVDTGSRGDATRIEVGGTNCRYRLTAGDVFGEGFRHWMAAFPGCVDRTKTVVHYLGEWDDGLEMDDDTEPDPSLKEPDGTVVSGSLARLIRMVSSSGAPVVQ